MVFDSRKYNTCGNRTVVLNNDTWKQAMEQSEYKSDLSTVRDPNAE